MRSLVASAIFTALATSASNGTANELCQPPSLLSTCLDADNLWLHADSDWLSQGPSALPKLAELKTTFATGYLLQPIGLARASADPDSTTSYAVEHRLGATFVAAFGLGHGLAMEAAVPFVAYQAGASTSELTGSETRLPPAALGDVRLGSHFRWPLSSPRLANWHFTSRFTVAFPSGNDAAFASAPGVVFAPGQNIAVVAGRWHFGADLGLRLKNHTQLANTLVGSQLSISLGAGVEVIQDDWLRLDLEAFGWLGLLRQTVQERRADGTLVEFDSRHVHWPAEWLFSLRTGALLAGRLGARLAVGSFIPTGASSATAPLFRAILSADYRFDMAAATH